MNQYRYPGAKPFSTNQQDIFFGRDEDIQQLYELISLEDLVVLYAKSGLGKSSLLNAGILPRIQKEGQFRPFQIRFGAFTAGQTATPVSATRAQIALPEKQISYLDKILPDDNSLWRQIKDQQAYGGGNKSFLLLFDQFEELFTYPEEKVLVFKQELKELLNRQVPQRFREILEKQYAENAVQVDDSELEWLHRPFDLKVVVAIRSDRMSLLNQLKDYLPNILRHCYELDSLTEAQAEDAILNPAYKKGKTFLTPPFDYEDEALDAILDFLTRGHTQKIESFQLQILCQSIERRVIGEKLSVVGITDIGDFEHIYKHYYDDQIALLGNSADQLAARKLIEDGLIFEEEERRLSLYEGQIHKSFDISPQLLRKLVDSHLLRAEPSMQGGYTYELSHDTLVAPVLQAKAKRREEEQRQAEVEIQRIKEAELAALREKAEEERLRAEKERHLREKAQRNEKRARQRTRLAAFVSLIALLLALLAWRSDHRSVIAKKQAIDNAALAEKKSKEAEKNYDQAKEAEQKANDALARLQEQQNATEEQRHKAEANLEKAKLEEAKAKAAVEQLEKEKNATEEQRRLAVANQEKAERERMIAEENAEMFKQANIEIERTLNLVRDEKIAKEEALRTLEETNEKFVRLMLQNANKDILALDFLSSLEKTKTAASLGVLNEEIIRSFMEIAFWDCETGDLIGAAGVMDTISKFLDNPALKNLTDQIAMESEPSEKRMLIHQAMQLLDQDQFNALFEKKYYPEMVFVSGGTFNIGRTVLGLAEITRTESDFLIGKTETTVWQFALYCRATGLDIQNFIALEGEDIGSKPIVNISWYQAVEYANWVSRQKGLPEAIYKGFLQGYKLDTTGSGYRLPTETEWEFAAKGGNYQSPFEFAGSDNADQVAWYKDNCSHVQSVGLKKANALGLYDMSGNVFEWCWDWYLPYDKGPLKDFTGPSSHASDRVMRGGSWIDRDLYCSIYERNGKNPGRNVNNIGFRLAKSL